MSDPSDEFVYHDERVTFGLPPGRFGCMTDPGKPSVYAAALEQIGKPLGRKPHESPACFCDPCLAWTFAKRGKDAAAWADQQLASLLRVNDTRWHPDDLTIESIYHDENR